VTDTAKPLLWRAGDGPFHWDPLTYAGGEVVTEDLVQNCILRATWSLNSYCGMTAVVGDVGVEVRRTAPPVAQQCQWCRAAKAKQKGAGK